MLTITESEYYAVPKELRGRWSAERTDWGDWDDVRRDYMGMRTLFVNEPDGSEAMLIDGLTFRIVLDEPKQKNGTPQCDAEGTS